MASVWKRLQRVNKRAAKFQYTASYHRIDLETSPKWKPNKLSIVWTRRSRRVVTSALDWEPSLKDPLKGSVIFLMPENQTVAVTLFKDSRTNELEDKDWTFVLEDVSSTGKRRRLATTHINMRKHASLEPTQRTLTVPLEPTTQKIASASIQLTLHCVLLREGCATDEDMQSLASLLSVNNNSDIAVLEDLDEDDYTLSDQSTKQVLDFRQQMEEMTQSLTSSDIAATPNSVQSLSFDNCRTPTGQIPYTMDTPTTPVNKENPFTLNLEEKTQTIDTNFPKFEPKPTLTSTPQDLKFDGLKPMSFKPKTVTKVNLRPLDLKINLNSLGLDANENGDSDKTPTGEVEKVMPKNEKDKTPVQDLLEWCQSVTREYRSCSITNLTTSFQSGLALCAIIHRFRPDLLDFSGLQPDNADTNLRTALEASSKLGISQVITVKDICTANPDRLAIMTYLFQLRAHFTGNELQVEQLGNEESESSYLVGRHDTDEALPRDLFRREVVTRRSNREISKERKSPDIRPSSILHQSKALLDKVLSPTRDSLLSPIKDSQPTAKWFDGNVEEPPPRPEILMTRKELTDPFASDDEENLDGKEYENDDKKEKFPSDFGDPLTALAKQQEMEQKDIKQKSEDNNITISPELPKPTPQLLSRHDELKERARLLLEATKKEAREKERVKKQREKEKDDFADNEIMSALRNGDSSPTSKKPMTEEERQTMLRERARKLIADARAGIVSPTSPLSPNRASPQKPVMEVINRQTIMEQIAQGGLEQQLDAILARAESVHSSPGSRKSMSPDRSEKNSEDTRSIRSNDRISPLRSFTNLVDNLDDKDDSEVKNETGSYIQSELEALEHEQKCIDERAAALEKLLRRVMANNSNTEEEDRLMSQWFNLVNKKNALLRRQMQLNILEQEEDLSRRCELLARELRLSLAIAEWSKTTGQRRRERLLLQELLAAVNERDRLVQEMDEQERAIADDDEIERNLSKVELQPKNNCILQ